ncbi:ABC transporter permease, partial [Mesorhizobium sp. M7A.F.Ca.CA.002.04.1.1]
MTELSAEHFVEREQDAEATEAKPRAQRRMAPIVPAQN